MNHVSEAKYKFNYEGVDVVVDEDEDLLEAWQCDAETEDLFEFDAESFHERSEGEGPPELNEEELKALDAQATVEEVNRLREIGVIESADNQVEPEGLVFLDTTNVFECSTGVFEILGGKGGAELWPGSKRPSRRPWKNLHLCAQVVGATGTASQPGNLCDRCEGCFSDSSSEESSLGKGSSLGPSACSAWRRARERNQLCSEEMLAWSA